MPRLHPKLIRQAYLIEPVLTRLLPVCRDIPSARRELRWIREHASRVFRESSRGDVNGLVNHNVMRRSNGEPLQYILGSEFFGDLEIKCRPGVLIPRRETAASVTHLVNLLSSNVERLPLNIRLLDLCTGSGCIPILFHHEFYLNATPEQDVFLDILGVDVSSAAIDLAKENHALQTKALNSGNLTRSIPRRSFQSMAFLQADVLRDIESTDPRQPLPLLQALRRHNGPHGKLNYDILISNPPYISSSDYWRTTSPSVRKFEPRLALVPPASLKPSREPYDGDLFYHHILRSARDLHVQVLLVEVADLDQAERVASLIVQQDIWSGVEVWCDDPNGRSHDRKPTLQVKSNTEDVLVPIRGYGEGRSVLAYRERGASWLGKT